MKHFVSKKSYSCEFQTGFLSTEDEILAGNLGLKDQSLALRWTSENIAYFGGDPNRIILVGYSAGSSSVQYHYLSPLSRGLFHGSIGLSGTVFNPWGFTLGAREKAEKLGAIFNCPTRDSRKLVDCLKEIPAQTLVAATKEFQVMILILLMHYSMRSCFFESFLSSLL